MTTWVELEKERKKNEGKVSKTNKRASRNELSSDIIAEIIKREMEFPKGVLITVLNAVLDDDLLHMKVTLSILPETKQKEVLKDLQKQSGLFRMELAKKYPGWRQHPKIHFVGTNEIVKQSEVLQLLDSIHE